MWLISQVGPIKKYSQVGALGLRLFYCEMFEVKSEGNLMPDALNQLVGSHRWISATWTLLWDTLSIAHLQLSSDGIPMEKRPMCLPTLKKSKKNKKISYRLKRGQCAYQCKKVQKEKKCMK